jgi:hypothetical protein
MAAGRKKKPALLHAAKKEAGTGGAAYRALPPGAAGIASAAEIEREEQFCAIYGGVSEAGFHFTKAG